MMVGDVLSSPWSWIAVLIAFCSSLVACKQWWKRIMFTFTMPILYGFVWVITYLGIGGLLLLFDGWIHARVLGGLALVLSIAITTICFVFQVVAMSGDRYHVVYASGLGSHPPTPEQMRPNNPLRRRLSQK